MLAEAEVVVCQKSVSALEVQYYSKGTINHHVRQVHEVETLVAPGPSLSQVRVSESVSADLSGLQTDVKPAERIQDSARESSVPHYVPSIRSGSFTDIGPRRYMEDEHVRIDDLSSHMGSLFKFPKPSAFYGVFDGHGGPEAAAFVRKNVFRLFFEDAIFPQSWEVNEGYSKEVEKSLCRSFLLADQALADESGVSSSSGTTALTAIVLGRLLVVANAGDCRAVLCRKGEAVDMSQDHRPTYPSERRRVEELGGFIDDGYLNGVLSVTRALGDWDVKFPRNSPSPLIAEPELKQVVLTEDDEFLIIACDGIWDVMSSQQAVNIVRRGLRRHDDPELCARDLVREALRRSTFDNLTVVVVCLSSAEQQDLSPPQRKLRCCSLSAEALFSLKSWLDSGSSSSH